MKEKMMCLFIAFCISTALWSTQVASQDKNEIFFQAVKERDLNKIEELIRDGFVVKEISDANGWTPLHFAASLGDEKIIQFLLNEGVNIEAKETRYGLTPLHMAASMGLLEIVKLLVKNKVFADPTDINGYTPLILAASEGNLDVVRFLADQKANLQARGSDGRTALHFAAIGGHIETVSFLIKDGGFDKDVADDNGATPLHFASKRGRVEVVRFLLAQDANKKARDKCDSTPLIWAIIANHLEAVSFLVDKDENGNIVDNDYNKQALEIVRKEERADIILFLETGKLPQNPLSDQELFMQRMSKFLEDFREATRVASNCALQ